ncbi:SDR family NAD(P)-dependent oxidoreductase [Roseixanthobacter glucoisosaccharinicivorans]|uniref:SDR family NAD(P)-dependent oxidoreductase n=1 Tax=Roseixanthobacter glucoisosaccharinicivorans TaxID=3119923 RepID=UPI003729CB31
MAEGEQARPLAGRAAIITGGGAGIGRAIALRLAADGARVGVVDLDPQAAAHTRDLIVAAGGEAASARADVAEAQDIGDAIHALRDSLGGLDVLVNNAGIMRLGAIADLPKAHWEAMFRINVDGIFHACQAAVPLLTQEGTGRIINMSSWLGKSGKAFYGGYCATKFAILGLTESLALELAPRRITVNAICPGIITDTAMRARGEEDALRLGLEGSDKRVAAIPLGRLGMPEDVAGVAAFLASDAAAYMTGQALTVAGGLWRH